MVRPAALIRQQNLYSIFLLRLRRMRERLALLALLAPLEPATVQRTCPMPTHPRYYFIAHVQLDALHGYLSSLYRSLARRGPPLCAARYITTKRQHHHRHRRLPSSTSPPLLLFVSSGVGGGGERRRLPHVAPSPSPARDPAAPSVPNESLPNRSQ